MGVHGGRGIQCDHSVFWMITDLRVVSFLQFKRNYILTTLYLDRDALD